jgi:hypothetical protein
VALDIANFVRKYKEDKEQAEAKGEKPKEQPLLHIVWY